MLVSLSSCLTALNKSGENVTDDKTDDIKESETEQENETSEQSETSVPNEETQEITEPVQTEGVQKEALNHPAPLRAHAHCISAMRFLYSA